MSEVEQFSHDSSFTKFFREYSHIIKSVNLSLYPKTVDEIIPFISLIYEIISLVSKKKEVEKLKTQPIEEIPVIESPDLTEIVSEGKNLEDLIETNRVLFNENKRLTDKFIELNENYETLVNESNLKISDLENRIKQLVESKVSISKVPKYWVQDIFKETESIKDIEI